VNLGRVERTYVHIAVTATLHDGSPAELTAVDVALLPPRTTPTATTVWAPADLDGGSARVLLAGPDAPADGALTVPAAGADLWVRVADSPEVDTAHVERVTVS
jgi:hypothetical protein